MGLVERDHSIALTEVERDAVVELGVRPTFSLDCGAAFEGDVELMLANAALWTQAAGITSAGRTGLITDELRAQINALLDEAIPEALADLEQATRHRELWRAGSSEHGFPQLGEEATEARYAEEIERDRRVLHGLQSLAAKLDRPPRLSGCQAGCASRSSFRPRR
jgi:hypothetical protein